MIKTLKGRLALIYTFLFTIIALIVFFYIYQVLTGDLNTRIDEELLDDAQEIVTIFEDSGLSEAADEILLEVEGKEAETVFYRLFSPQQKLLASSKLEYWRYLPVLPKHSPAVGKIIYNWQHIPEHKFEVRSIYCGMRDGHTLQIGVEPIENENLFRLFFETFSIAFVVLTMTGGFLALLVSKRAMSGIDRLRDSFIRVGHGDFTQPVTIGQEGEEIETLIDTFNQMQNKIQTLVEELHNVTNNIAHDLRSPVTRIRGMTETTLTGQQNLSEYRETAGHIVEECDSLVSMVNTMLEIAESDAGVITIIPETVDISHMIHDVADLFLPVAEDKSIDIQIELPLEPIQVTGDKSRLQRALANLLDNALKYTSQKNQITLSALAYDTYVCICVLDTGIGISEEDQKHIFDRFFRGDPSRSTPGNGLGLSLVKSIALLHHGDIQVTSVIGKGSCFQLTLPLYMQCQK